MKCICDDRQHDTGTALWHRAYCRWYDHDRAGNRRRAAAWGWVADRLASGADADGTVLLSGVTEDDRYIEVVVRIVDVAVGDRL